MTRKITSFTLVLLLILSLCTLSFGTVSADVSDLPEVKEGCNRYFFLMPEDWYNEYSDTAGIYWWEGTDACTAWPGYKAHKADADNVYYYDVPKDVEVIIWNNYVDGGADKTQDIYNAQQQTVDIGTVCYDPEENEYYPDGIDSFDGMIFVIDPDKTSTSVMAGKIAWEGDWFYYYGNGEYGTEEPLVNFEDLPQVEIGCYRYFFLMPDDWYNEYTDTAGIFWWDGDATPDEWPGYKAHKADAENIYYYDVPRSVSTIIWNNNIDGGTDRTTDIYAASMQTKNIGTEYYEPRESEVYPEGLPNFNGMIYVIEDIYTAGPYTPQITYYGEWYYYFGNGEYGTDVDKDARALKNMYPDNNYDYMTDIVPYFYPDRFEGKAGLPWDMYDTLYAHNDSADATPDYVVFEACVGGADLAFITKQFGDYYVTHQEIHSLYELSHFVFVPSEQKVYTLKEAWEKEDLDIMPAFTSGKVGRHRGDANLDGSFNIKDATYIQKYLAQFDGFENTGFMNYDGDNDITIKDATAIQKSLAGIKD